MKKVLTWIMALLIGAAVPAGPAANAEEKSPSESAGANTTTASSDAKTTSTDTTSAAADTTTAPTTNSSTVSDGTDGQNETGDKDDGDKETDEDQKQEDTSKTEKGNGKEKKLRHEEKEQKREKMHKGIEKALKSLLKARGDGNGEAGNEALDAVIEKLKAMLKEDGTVSTDEEAEQAVEEKLESDVQQGTATEQQLEILVTLKVKGNKVDEAKSDVEAALAKKPDSDKLYDLLSKIYKEKGDTQRVKVYVKGKKPEFDVEPYIRDGRTMIPISAIAKALDAEVTWNGETQTAVIKKDGKTIEIPIGSQTIRVNGESKTVDKAAEITQSRTMVPVKFVSEFLGHLVEYDEQSGMVIVK